MGILLEFATNMSEVFPECPQTKEAIVLLTALQEDCTSVMCTSLIQQWLDFVDTNRAHFDRNDMESMLVQNTNPDSIVSSVDLKTKWNDPEFNEESKLIVWEYLRKLEKYARLDHSPDHVEESKDSKERAESNVNFTEKVSEVMNDLPPSMLTKIQDKMESFMSTNTLSDMNMSSLLELSHELQDELSNEEIEVITKHEDDISALLSQLM